MKKSQKKIRNTHINNRRRKDLSRRLEGKLNIKRNKKKTYHRANQINENEEPHRETTEPKEFRKDNQLQKIMHRRVDPSPSLRKQDAPRLGRHSVRDRVRRELGLERREVLHHERRQETIFTEREQILLVQGVDVGLGVFLDDSVRDDDRPSFVGGTDAVEGETTGQARHGAEKTLECLGQMM